MCHKFTCLHHMQICSFDHLSSISKYCSAASIFKSISLSPFEALIICCADMRSLPLCNLTHLLSVCYFFTLLDSMDFALDLVPIYWVRWLF